MHGTTTDYDGGPGVGWLMFMQDWAYGFEKCSMLPLDRDPATPEVNPESNADTYALTALGMSVPWKNYFLLPPI